WARSLRSRYRGAGRPAALEAARPHRARALLATASAMSAHATNASTIQAPTGTTRRSSAPGQSRPGEAGPTCSARADAATNASGARLTTRTMQTPATIVPKRALGGVTEHPEGIGGTETNEGCDAGLRERA